MPAFYMELNELTVWMQMILIHYLVALESVTAVDALNA